MKRIILCLLVCLSLYGCSENKMTKDLEESSLEEGKTDEFQETSMEKMEKERIFLPQNTSEMIVSQEWSDEK